MFPYQGLKACFQHDSHYDETSFPKTFAPEKYPALTYFPLELFGLKIINCIFALGY